MLASAMPSRLAGEVGGHVHRVRGQRGDDEGVLLHRDAEDPERRALFDRRGGVVRGRDADERGARDHRRLHRRVRAALEERDVEPALLPEAALLRDVAAAELDRMEPGQLQRDRRLRAGREGAQPIADAPSAAPPVVRRLRRVEGERIIVEVPSVWG
jgi:hypothetical protein